MSSLNLHSAIYSIAEAFQFYQKHPGEVIIRIIPTKGATVPDFEEFVRAFQIKVGSGVFFKSEIVEELMTNRGKRPFIIRDCEVGQ